MRLILPILLLALLVLPSCRAFKNYDGPPITGAVDLEYKGAKVGVSGHLDPKSSAKNPVAP